MDRGDGSDAQAVALTAPHGHALGVGLLQPVSAGEHLGTGLSVAGLGGLCGALTVRRVVARY